MPSYVDSLETIEVDSLPTMLAAAALQILKSKIGVKREVQCWIFGFVMKYRILENRVVDQILKSADQILKMQFG